MPERELWPVGLGTEPVTCVSSCDSMTSTNSTHSGLSDGSYDFLSAEEKECLLFLEETIGSLDKEADSGLSTDQSEPATPQDPKTAPVLQGSLEKRLIQEGSEQKRDIQSSLTLLQQAQDLGLKLGSHSLPRNIHISRDQNLREISTCRPSQSEGHIPRGLVSAPLENRGNSVASPFSPGESSELDKVLIPPPEAFRDTHQEQDTGGILSLKEKRKPGQDNLPWSHPALDTLKKAAFLKAMSHGTSEKTLEGLTRQPGPLSSENLGSEDFPFPLEDDKSTKVAPPTAPKSRKLPPNIILKTSRSNFHSDPPNRFSHRSPAAPRDSTTEHTTSVSSALQEQRRARREALEKLGLPQDHGDEPNLHLAKSSSIHKVVAIVMDMFTDVDLLSEVLDAAARRVPVYILLDEMNAQHFLDMAEKCRVNLHHVDFLRVRTVSGPTYYCRTGKSFKGHVKEKFLLVDCAVVLSGSYSFMWSFEKIHRSIAHVFQGELVSSFDEEFRILFAQSEPLIPAAGALALALTHADTYALTPYGGPGPMMGGPVGGPGSFFPKRAHLLFPLRDEGLGFPSFLDPDRHFLSAFRRDDLLRHSGGAGDMHGLRMLSRRPGMEVEAGHGGDPSTRGYLRAKHLEMEAGHGGDSGNRGFLRAKHLEMEAGNSGDPSSRGFLRAKHLEMDAFKRHTFADGAMENFASSRQVSRQMFVSHGDDFRFQTSHFHRDQLYQQHYQFEPQFTATRPQGLFEKLRAGRPGFGDPEDYGIEGNPRFPELESGFGPPPEGPGGHLRLDYVPSNASREVRHGSDPEPRGLEPGAPQRPNIGQRFLCQSSPTQKQSLEQRWFPPEAEMEMEPNRKGGAEGRAGLRNWRISSYLSGCHSDGGDEGLPGPMEAESYDEVLGDPPGRSPLPTGDLLPSSFRTGGPFSSKAIGGGDGPEREVADGTGLVKQDSFRSRLNPLIQRSSRLRSSLIFSSSQKEGPGVGTGAGATTEKVQLFQKEQTVSETVGEGGETVRTASSSKVAELLEKYKGPARDRDRDQDRTGGVVTVSKAAVSQSWREETGTGGGGTGGERRSLESCLLDLRDSFASRLHEEAERQPGAATLSAAQLLDTLGRGTDRLPSRFLTSDGRAALTQGRASPPPERKGSPTPAYPERKGSPVLERRGSPTPAYPERKGSPVLEKRGSPTSAYPERKGSPVPPLPERKGSPTFAYPERKGSPVPPLPERKGSPISTYADQRSSPLPPVPERRSSPIPPVPERRSSLTFAGDQKAGSPGEEDAGRQEPSPMEFLRKGSLRLKQLLSPKGEKKLEEEGGFLGPQENGQPESPHRPPRGDSPEVSLEERASRPRLASATTNALYSSNLRDDTKVILEQISAQSQKHRGGPGPGAGAGVGGAAHSSPELYRSPAAALDASRAHEMSDKDKCSAIFRSDSFGGQSRFSRTLPASLEERDTLLRKMESMRKEKRVYSRFEVFCKKEEAGAGEAGAGEAGAGEADARDRKVGKFMPKILGTFKTKK